ncbi:MAG: hypothetical protein GPJ54_21250 [Candidatus Heimdallarchaeota archaeon]|nr:hypothetical protein [Candidatus Heimdallarchaeota archaeon]
MVTKLLPNTLEGLKWGLENFDAIETDIRLSKDGDLVIHHDPVTSDGKIVADMTLSELKSDGLFLFSDFLNDPEINSKVKSGKHLWVELKPNCDGKKSVRKQIAYKLYAQILKEIDDSGFGTGNINILSFAKDLLNPIAKENVLPCYPILPNINECNPRFITLQGLPRVLNKSLRSHMNDCVENNYRGILFARQYIMGIFSLRHPSYSKLISLMDDLKIELGSNLGSVELESEYPLFHRFSDKTSIFPRYAKKGEGQIIAHRGTGTKGITISD